MASAFFMTKMVVTFLLLVGVAMVASSLLASLLAAGKKVVTFLLLVGVMMVVASLLASLLAAGFIFGFGKTSWLVVWNCSGLSFIVLLGWGDFILSL